jgi:YHS domain-containing protein
MQLLGLLIAGSCMAQPMHDRVMKVDVVELIGKDHEVEGKADFAATFGKFTYWFASEANMMAFLMNEDKYAIQFNGACARMGPLSGDGTPKLFAMHDGKVYIFASEQCKSRFEAEPENFICRDDPVPQATEDERKRGRLLLGRAVDAFACTAGIDNLSTLRQVASHDEESGGKTYHVTNNITFKFPDAVFDEVCWNDSCWANAVDGASGWALSSAGREPMNQQQCVFLQHTSGRHPITILRHRNDKDLIISSTGQKKSISIPDEGEIEVELVTVHRAGATTVLGIDDTGRVRLMAYRGRAGGSSVGEVECIYSQFHSIEGVRLAKRVDVSVDGKSVASECFVFAEQVINDPKDAAKFEQAIPAGATSSAGDAEKPN